MKKQTTYPGEYIPPLVNRTNEKPKPKPIQARERTPLEKDIEERVCRYAKDLNFYTMKFTSPNHRSVPDRMLISPGGCVVFIEFKAPRQKATQGQQREIDRLKYYGQRVYIIDDVAKGKRLIDRLVSEL